MVRKVVDMISEKYKLLVNDLERYVDGYRDYEDKYIILLHGLLQLRFSVSERFHQGLSILHFNEREVFDTIKSDITELYQYPAYKNPYFAFYFDILEYVNGYCLKRIESVQLPLELRSENVG